jgi:hypothetical protein
MNAFRVDAASVDANSARQSAHRTRLRVSVATGAEANLLAAINSRAQQNEHNEKAPDDYAYQ